LMMRARWKTTLQPDDVGGSIRAQTRWDHLFVGTQKERKTFGTRQ